MPTPRKNQKQIAQRYAGNLRYYQSLTPLRRLKRVLSIGALVAGAVVAVLYLTFGRSSQKLEWLNSSGAISKAHAAFAQDCKKCHDPALNVDPLRFTSLTSSLDANCVRCHAVHTFHDADTVVGHSCVDCHHEHLGSGPMKPVANANCQACHGNADIMAASAQKAAQLPASDFRFVPRDNLVYFQPPRPPEGYTKVINSFSSDHPEFQIQRDNLTDPDTLKFNHQLHLTGDIPLVNGKKLDCAYCHQPDSHGVYMQPISFARNCQACHSLQVDPTLPGLQIPHPQGGAGSSIVRNFLLTLPTQYQLYATQHMQELNISTPGQVADFVNQHMQGIRARVRQGDDLVQDVFFADATRINLGAITGPSQRALFPGCAYCHEVKTMANSFNTPVVTKPVMPDRWYVHARFDHSAHKALDCTYCHSLALQSTSTAEIMLPDKTSCAECHSAKGGVVATCVTCHSYHNPDTTQGPGVAQSSPLRDMMLSGR
jgi:hypothetical protein